MGAISRGGHTLSHYPGSSDKHARPYQLFHDCHTQDLPENEITEQGAEEFDKEDERGHPTRREIPGTITHELRHTLTSTGGPPTCPQGIRVFYIAAELEQKRQHIDNHSVCTLRSGWRNKYMKLMCSQDLPTRHPNH